MPPACPGKPVVAMHWLLTAPLLETPPPRRLLVLLRRDPLLLVLPQAFGRMTKRLPLPQQKQVHLFSAHPRLSIKLFPGDLFAALSKGEGVTSGLKKVMVFSCTLRHKQSLFIQVDDSMKTHKNPELRASGSVPDKAPVVVAKSAVTKTPAVVKPPRFELQDKKWVVENQVSLRRCAFGRVVVHITNFRLTTWLWR